MPDHDTPSLPPPRVAVQRGWGWWREGFHLFREQPLTMLLFGLVYCMVLLGFQLLPGVGSVLAVFLGPLLTAGFLQVAARLTRAEEPRLAELFAAFRQPGVASLLGIGLWYLVMLMSVAFLVTLLAVALGLAPSPEALQAEPISQDTMDQLLTLGMMVMLAALPVAAAYWLAPALVTFEQASAAEAMWRSLRFMWRNLGAFALYLSGMAMLTLAALLTYGAAFIVVAPLSMLSLYACYRDLTGQGPVQIDNAGWVE